MAQLKLEIVTPDRLVLSEIVDSICAPGYEGEFGVLPGHIPFLSALQTGCLSYKKNAKDFFAFVAGGFAEVSDNKVTILAEIAEMAKDIDTARAEQAARRAKQHSEKKADNYDSARAHAALTRAVSRLAAHQRASQSGSL